MPTAAQAVLMWFPASIRSTRDRMQASSVIRVMLFTVTHKQASRGALLPNRATVNTPAYPWNTPRSGAAYAAYAAYGGFTPVSRKLFLYVCVVCSRPIAGRGPLPVSLAVVGGLRL